VKLDEENRDKENIGLKKFFKASKEATRKFDAFKSDGEGVFHYKAIAVTKALTFIGEGDFYFDDPIIHTAIKDEETGEVIGDSDQFADNGFVMVEKIVED